MIDDILNKGKRQAEDREETVESEWNFEKMLEINVFQNLSGFRQPDAKLQIREAKKTLWAVGDFIA